MVEFFKPSKRKIGVLMLVLACVLVAGWVRSLNIEDCFSVTIARSHIYIGSTSGVLIYLSFPAQPNENQTNWSSDEIKDGHFTMMYVETPREYDIEWTGFRYHHASGTLIIPYWSIVVPLTLLSAYLLLSKSRVAKPPEST